MVLAEKIYNNYPFFPCHSNSLSRAASFVIFIIVANAAIGKFYKPCIPPFHAIVGVMLRNIFDAVSIIQNVVVLLFTQIIPV